MDLKKEIVKILVLALIGIPFFFIGGPVLFPLIYIFWKYIKLCIKIDIFVIYLMVRIPIWLVIQVPVWAFGKSFRGIERFFNRGLRMFTGRKKTALLIFIPMFLLGVFIFQPDFSLSAGSILANLYSSSVSIAMTVIMALSLTFLILSLIAAFKGGEGLGRSPFDMPARGMMEETRGSAFDAGELGIEYAEKGQEAARQAKEMKGVYDDIRSQGVKSAAKESSLWPEDVIANTKKLGRMFSPEAAGGEAAAGAATAAEGEAAAGAAAAGGPFAAAGAAVIIGIILLAMLVFVIQVLLVVGFMISLYQFWIPVVGAPLMAAAGLSEDYGNYFGSTVANQYLAGVGVDMEDEFVMVRDARQRVYCVLKGPSCLRQWRLNNTQKPGSDAVGETYGLKIDRFEVGSGSQVDVSYKNGDYTLPISFGLSNNRHGLKGINALNVSYRIKIIDFDRGRDNPYCQTGWNPINGYSINEEDDTSRFKENDLYPGTSASTGFLTLDEINLKNCEMLQPALGEHKTVLLKVRYDYSSQATLYFQGMSRQALQADPEIQREWEPSKTADTPVKSVINVNSPVIFDEEALSEGFEAARPFSMRARLNTDNSRVEYKINDFQVIKSDSVTIAEEGRGSGANQCQFDQKGSSNILTPSGSANDIIAGEGEQEGEERWFTSGNPPPFFGCTMKLSDPGQINPTGETLTMDVLSNYTVRLSERLERFEAINSRCTDFNCPLLVTQSFAEENPLDEDVGSGGKTNGWKTKCTGADAGNGCEVVRGGADEWDTIELMTGGRGDGQAPSPRLDSELESGEIALNPSAEDNNIPFDRSIFMESANNAGLLIENPERLAIGLRERRIDRMVEISQDEERGFALVSSKDEDGGTREVELRTLNYQVCEENYGEDKYSSPQEAFRKYFLENYDTGDNTVLIAIDEAVTSGGDCVS